MFRSLLQSMITVVLLVIFCVLATINLWQQNNIEKRQLEMQKEQENAEFECIASGNSSSEKEDLGPWGKYELALQDENNLLELDQSNW